jgi:hypothetical protein
VCIYSRGTSSRIDPFYYHPIHYFIPFLLTMFKDNCENIMSFMGHRGEDTVLFEEKESLLTPALQKEARRAPFSLSPVGKISFAPALEGLRGVAVMLVMVSHVLPGKEMLGTLGVGIFFVLSGFLITGGLVSSLVSKIGFEQVYITK